MAGRLNDEIHELNQIKRISAHNIAYYSAWQSNLNNEMLERADAVTRQQNPDLCELIWGYMKIRADERMSWSRYAQRKGTARDLHDVSVAIAWLQEQGIHSVDEFRQRFTEVSEAVSEAQANVSSSRQALHSLEICRKHLSNRAKYAPVYEKYRGIYFKMFKEKFEQEHRQELESYRTAVRYFKAHPEYDRMKAADVDAKMKLLQSRIEQGEEALPALQQSLQPYLQVQKYLRLATEPPPIVEQKENSVEMEQRKPAPEEQIHHEPTPRKKRSNDLSL